MNWSQSKAKDFPTMCPRRFEGVYVHGLRPKPTEEMVKGLYFEYKCLGATAHGDTPQLALLSTGKKSADHQRIDDQVVRFNELFRPDSSEYQGHEITHRQLLLSAQFEDTTIEGTLDFVTKAENHYVNDLKLTSDINGYWGDPSQIDHTQAITYSWLYEKNFGVWPSFRYWVFDYSTKKNVKIIDILVTDETLEKTLRLYTQYDKLFSHYAEEEEFPTTPDPLQCSKCLVSCADRLIKSTIQYEQVRV